jgi:hypothetical protein
MVNALSDAWRVLVNNGTLLDLRPLAAKYQLELVTPAAAIPIGHTDTTARSEDDAAANAAVAWAVDEGLFASRSRVEFDIEILWESVSDLERYMMTRASTRVTPSYEELERSYQSAAVGSNARPRLRASRRVMLAAFDRRITREPRTFGH